MSRSVSNKTDTPAKAFEVVVIEKDGQDKVLNWACAIPCLLPDYNKALKNAKTATKQDGKIRWVQLRQVLLSETVQ